MCHNDPLIDSFHFTGTYVDGDDGDDTLRPNQKVLYRRTNRQSDELDLASIHISSESDAGKNDKEPSDEGEPDPADNRDDEQNSRGRKGKGKAVPVQIRGGTRRSSPTWSASRLSKSSCCSISIKNLSSSFTTQASHVVAHLVALTVLLSQQREVSCLVLSSC